MFCNKRSGWYIWTIDCKNHKFIKCENNESTSCMTQNIRISFCFKTYMHAYTKLISRQFSLARSWTQEKLQPDPCTQEEFLATTHRRGLSLIWFWGRRKKTPLNHIDGKSLEYTSVQYFFECNQAVMFYSPLAS